MQLPDRIEQKIVRIPFSGCWIWMGAAADDRYGSVHYDGKTRRAHRVTLELSGVVIPDGQDALHTCDVGLCVNPYHLFVGTHQDNMDDMVSKGRARAPTGDAHWTRKDPDRAREIGRRNIVKSHGCGEANANAKVTRELAELIRNEHRREPSQSMTSLGERHGLGRETTRKIVKGIAPWKF